MGKGRRKGGKAASGRSGGRGHSAGGAPSSFSSSFGGLINPSFLAAAAAARRSGPLAAAAASASAAPSASSPAAAKKSSNKKNNKRKKNASASAINPDVRVGEVTAPATGQARGDGDGEGKKRKKSKKRKTCSSTSIEQDAKAAGNDDSGDDKTRILGGENKNASDDATVLLTFGHPRWTDLQQLVRLLLFPLPSLDNASSAPTNQSIQSTSGPVLRIVFVSQADQVRDLAMLCKPLLHPFPVMMMHNKVKRNQIQDGLREVLASLISASDDDTGGGAGSIQCESAIATRGPVIFVADSALDRLVSAFRSTVGGGVKNAKANTKGGRKKSKKSKKTMKEDHHALKSDVCSGQTIPLGIHFEYHGSEAVRKARTASLGAVATSHQAKDIDAAGTTGINDLPLEVVLDGKRTDIDPGQDDRGIVSGSAGGHAATIAIALPSNQWIPQQSEQQIVEGIVNSAKREYEGPVGSPRERSAKEKLLARLVVLDARLQAKAQRIKDGGNTMSLNLPAVQGMTDGKISNVVEKMRILGIIGPGNAGGQSEREAAQTRWMDNAKGSSFGGTWTGSVRYGASGDDTSRDLASKLAMWKSGDNSERGASDGNCGEAGIQCLPCGEGDAWRSLMHWKPNPSSGDPLGSVAYNSDDKDDEGRKDFGSCSCAKACGHNETAMFYLRPFCALEVLNSRVCSLASPAPGNQGFEGCLEYLRRMCAAAGRTLTYWDSECFALIDGRDGDRCKDGLAPVLRLQKRELLVLSKEQLKEVLDHGRLLAVSDGQEVSPPCTAPVLSPDTSSAISNDLRTKMIVIGLLRV